MRRKMFIFILILCVILPAAGCGGGGGTSARSSEGPSEGTVLSAEEPPDDSQDEQHLPFGLGSIFGGSDSSSGSGGGSGRSSGGSSGSGSGSGGTGSTQQGEHYEIPEFLDVEFNEADAEYGGGAYIDTSHVEDGYVGVSATASTRLKFQIMYDDITYTFNLPQDGTVNYFPLACGDGSYHMRVMVNVTDNRYSEMFSTTSYVELEDEFQPFLRPSQYVDYSEDSDCVELAAEMAEDAEDELDFITQVYTYIVRHVTYDYDLAATVTSGYLPDPDRTLDSGKGICFDYAALAAAMLRSQGIPTKLITGYVAPNDLFHAWNMIYTEKAGWIAVEFEAPEGDWSRIDLTFSANGSNGDFIGDGTNYADLYQY